MIPLGCLFTALDSIASKTTAIAPVKNVRFNENNNIINWYMYIVLFVLEQVAQLLVDVFD